MKRIPKHANIEAIGRMINVQKCQVILSFVLKGMDQLIPTLMDLVHTTGMCSLLGLLLWLYLRYVVWLRKEFKTL